MRRFGDGSKWTPLARNLSAVIALSILIISFTDVGKRLWFPHIYDPELSTALSKPLRLEVTQSGEFEEVQLALRTFHYRAQSRGVAVYSDFFYDTPDWKLYRNGYSYRFRERRGDDGNVDYSLRLKRELRFVKEGAKVVLSDINEEFGERSAAQLRESGADALFVRLDVTSEQDWINAVQTTVSTFGKLDVLVNNAGTGARFTVEDTSEEVWDGQMNVHAKGVFLGTKHAIPEMRRAGGGSRPVGGSYGRIRSYPGNPRAQSQHAGHA